MPARVRLDFAIPADLDHRVEQPNTVRRRVSFDPIDKRHQPDSLPMVDEEDEEGNTGSGFISRWTRRRSDAFGTSKGGAS